MKSIKDIYKIDFNKLYSEGVKIILFDLDNTIIGYHETLPSEKDKLFIENLKKYSKLYESWYF